MRTVAVITLLDDENVISTIDSLLKQTVVPDRILVAYAGDDNWLFQEMKDYGGIVDVRKIYGSVGESRNQTLPLIDEDIIAFIDSDEIAFSDWIEKITKPIKDGEADYTGGKCIPFHRPVTKVERYVWEKEDELFANYDQLSFQMGNTAWNKKIFDQIGNFDKRIIWGGEDYDINIRATNAGFKGKYVPNAFLYHNPNIRTLSKWARKRYKYHTGSTIAYLKNNIDIKGKQRTMDIGSHPLDYLDLMLKVFAFVRGNIIWRRMK